MLKKTGILILVLAFFSISIHASGNTLQNPGFEDSNSLEPTGWSSSAFKNTPADVVFSVKDTDAFEGKNCLSISNISDNDSKVFQEISVIPGSIYKVSCRIKTENILNQAGSANITLELANNYGIYTSKELSNTNNNWELLEFNVRVPQEADKLVKFSLRLGGQGILNKGTAYFDEVVFELLENSGTLPIEEFFIPDKSSTSNAANSQKQGSSSTILFVILAFIIVLLIIFVELKLKKGNKGNSELSESDNDDFLEDSDDELDDEFSEDNDDEIDEESTDDNLEDNSKQ